MFARCIAEWADHVLQRSLCWATLILLRASIVDRIAGGLSSIFAKLLHLFDTLRTGIVLPGNDGDFVLSAVFRGMLADLIGHQSLSAWKGPNAVRGCTRCSNLCNRKAGRAAHEVGPEDHDESQWVPLTNEEIFLMVENLAEFVDSGSSDAQCKALATELGFNHQPLGILLDKSVRGVYQPAQQHLTDWMHTWCQDGTANIGVAMIIARMGALVPAISVPMLQTFLSGCVLPKMRNNGKADPEWIAPKRLKGGSLTAFASMMLCVVPCLALLLDLYGIAPQLVEEVACFMLMHQIISVLRMGPSAAMKHCDYLTTMITEHHRFFAKLYPDKAACISNIGTSNIGISV